MEAGKRVGREKKYKSAKSLSEAVNAYFAAISRTVTATEQYDTGERDGDGHRVYGHRPILNDDGIEIRYVEYVKPPTIGGLCGYLHIHRSTWAEYCNRPEYASPTTGARERVREWLEEQLVTRRDVRGIIFDLQNNFGYAEKQEIEFGPRAERTLAAGTIPISEREALLREIAREFHGEQLTFRESENSTNETGE